MPRSPLALVVTTTLQGMFALLQPHPAGNAVRVILAPPQAAATWRVLRRTSDTITGPDDSGAVAASDWGRVEGFIDTDGLLNGTEYFYQVFYRDAAGDEILPRVASAAVTPAYTARDTSTDVLGVLFERFTLAVNNAVEAGLLRPASGWVPVKCAPFVNALTMLPMVTMHMDSDQPAEFAISALTGIEDIDGIGQDEAEGWMSQVSINIIAVSQNPDERATLGRLLKHIVAANIEIFEERGLLKPAIGLAHDELLPEENSAPLYVAKASFTCLAASDATAAGVGIATVTTALETTNG